MTSINVLTSVEYPSVVSLQALSRQIELSACSGSLSAIPGTLPEFYEYCIGQQPPLDQRTLSMARDLITCNILLSQILTNMRTVLPNVKEQTIYAELCSNSEKKLEGLKHILDTWQKVSAFTLV